MPASGPRAIVVFEDSAQAFPLALLARGFRHCFCLIGAGQSWTVCDPLKTRIELTPLLAVDELELATHYHHSGRAVLLGQTPSSQCRLPYRFRPLSCVEVVKRILNIDAPGAFTPRQLYRALLSQPLPFVPFAPGSDIDKAVLDHGNY